MKLLLAPSSLLIYETLRPRKHFSQEETQRYKQVKKGFAGEKELSHLLQSNNYKNIRPLFDCLFDFKGSEFQIDCILLTEDTIFLLEVKNYTSEYYMENNNLYHLA